MRPQKRYVALGRALRVEKRTGKLVADPYDAWGKEVARLNEAGRALYPFATKRLNAREYDKAARGAKALDPIALTLLTPQGMSSIELSAPGKVEPTDEILFTTGLEIFQKRGASKMSTEELVRALAEHADPGGWARAATNGNIAGLARQLADRLRLYRVSPRTIRIGSYVRKGYRVDDLNHGLSRYRAYRQMVQDDPQAVVPIPLRARAIRSNPELVNRVLRRVGVLGCSVQRLTNDPEFLKHVLQHLDPHFQSLQQTLKRMRSGESFRIAFSALPEELLIDASREAMAVRTEFSLFEEAGWRLRWCRHKGHIYVGNGRGRAPIDCPAHRYGGRKARQPNQDKISLGARPWQSACTSPFTIRT